LQSIKCKSPYYWSYYFKKEQQLKTYLFEEVQDELLGKIGTPNRDKYEDELKVDLLGKAIEQTKTLSCQYVMNSSE